MQKSSDYIRNFVTIFFVQKTVIFGVGILIIAGAFLFALLYPPIYAATASVILKGSITVKNPESIEDMPADISQMRENDVYSEIEIIKANVVAEKTADELIQKGLVFKNVVTENDRRSAARKIMANVAPSINPRTETINIQTTWNDPETARQILEVLIQKYFDFRSEIFKPREAETFFAEQLRKFSQELNQRENELMQLTIAMETPDSALAMENNMRNVDSLEQQLLVLKQQYFDQKYKVDLMKTDIQSSETSFFSYVGNPQLNDMSNMVMEIVRQRNVAARTFHPQSQKIQNYNKQIAAAFGEFKKEVSTYLKSEIDKLENISQKIRFLEDRIKKVRSENMSLYEASVRAKMLKRQIDVLEDSYVTFNKRLEEAKISNTYQTSSLFTVSLLARPEAQKTPIFPNKRKVMLMGILAGIICGVAAGFTMEFFNHTFKTPEEVENNTDMVYIFSIPE
ncbi:MAG: hypothetical protein K9K21_07815 [Desulfotignum sp.]|nr:hypothetical protein [Desulfotignum sp.]